ncbi:MAG TPA: DUF998 domain-containing protein [Patescibacteria group bacterium]|nr:DUF998 domain-containing protein [Patescibacteria group bacterium]
MGKIAGVLFALAGFVILMGITTAESFYPGYNLHSSYISWLGATPPPNIIIKQPSATIFDLSMVFAGILILAGGIFFYRRYGNKILFAPILFMGLGTLGVGLFPASHASIHPLIAGIAFAAGGIAGILSYRKTTAPFRYLALVLGLVTLGFLILGILDPKILSPLGIGGAERWVAYPITIWLILFGGYLMGPRPTSKASKIKSKR